MSGLPCYVGKGKGKRRQQHNAAALSGRHTNPILTAVIRKYGPLDFVPVLEGLTESEAFEAERALIAKHGRRNNRTGSLCNLTDGGEGASGLVISSEARAKMRAAKIGKKLTAEHVAKVSAQLKGRKLSAEKRHAMKLVQHARLWTDEERARTSAVHKGKVVSEATRKRISAAQKARWQASPDLERMHKMQQANVGRKATPEHKAKCAAAFKLRMANATEADRYRWGKNRRGKSLSPEARAKISAARKGQRLSEESKAKISASGKGRTHSPEVRAKIGASQKGKTFSPEVLARMKEGQRRRRQRDKQIPADLFAWAGVKETKGLAAREDGRAGAH